ncbi:MAG: hypothetical protein JO100_02400 [Pseudonocardia sp.]|nr:hypothetical protein [Pseudonocardia sp.]
MVSGALERGATVLLEHVGTRLWGFPPRLMSPIVTQLGPIRALSWFVCNMPQYERTLSVFGAVRTHLLCTTISLINGCRYCSYGHGYALGLAYLHEHGRLFPLSERTLGELCGLAPGVIRHHIVKAVHRAGLHNELRWLERAITLTTAEDQRPTDYDDARISHLVRMFGVLNSVGNADNTEPDEAHSPLNKDYHLKLRYAELWAASTP